jgi:hypothetical protein
MNNCVNETSPRDLARPTGYCTCEFESFRMKSSAVIFGSRSMLSAEIENADVGQSCTNRTRLAFVRLTESCCTMNQCIEIVGGD